MSRTLTSNHFNVENLEFDGLVSNYLGFSLYQGFAVINDCYMTFGLSVEEKLTIFLHDYHGHSADCQLCFHGDDPGNPIYKVANTHHDELFKLIIHHPAVRLHWMMINPSDYEVET